MALEKVMSSEDIQIGMRTIKDVIETPIATDNYKALQDRLMYLSSVISLTATLVADAKRNLLHRKNEVIQTMRDYKISPSILAKQIDAMCWEEEAMYEEAERMNKAVTRCGEWLQTVISAQKEEFKALNNNNAPKDQQRIQPVSGENAR